MRWRTASAKSTDFWWTSSFSKLNAIGPNRGKRRGMRSTVEWTFEGRADETSLVEIADFGFVGTAEEVVAEVIDESLQAEGADH